jgi:hypothetical protein
MEAAACCLPVQVPGTNIKIFFFGLELRNSSSRLKLQCIKNNENQSPTNPLTKIYVYAQSDPVEKANFVPSRAKISVQTRQNNTLFFYDLSALIKLNASGRVKRKIRSRACVPYLSCTPKLSPVNICKTILFNAQFAVHILGIYEEKSK